MAWLGEELKRQRELRGVSLGEIAEETKIGVRFLAAIEAGRFEVLPGGFYRTAFIRAYARYLGLDEERVVAAFKFASGGVSAGEPARTSSPRRVKSRRSQVAGTGLVLGAVLTGVTALWPRGSERSKLPSPPPPRAPAPAPDFERLPFVGSELGENPGASLRMLLRVEEPCWLELRSDGERLAEGLMLPGFEKELAARGEILLSLGNAGGVSFQINERPGKPLGRRGEVRKEIRITPENFEEFVAARPEPRERQL